MSPGEPPPLIIVRVKAPGAWCAGTNTSNYVTISVEGLAEVTNTSTHSAFPLLIATQWPGFKGLRIKCYTILTHIKYFCHFLHFESFVGLGGIAVARYHKVNESDVKAEIFI